MWNATQNFPTKRWESWGHDQLSMSSLGWMRPNEIILLPSNLLDSLRHVPHWGLSIGFYCWHSAVGVTRIGLIGRCPCYGPMCSPHPCHHDFSMCGPILQTLLCLRTEAHWHPWDEHFCIISGQWMAWRALTWITRFAFCAHSHRFIHVPCLQIFVSTFKYCSLAPSRPLTNLPGQLPLSRNSWIFLPLNTSPTHKVNGYVCFLVFSPLRGFPELHCSMVAVHFHDPSMTQAFPPFCFSWFQIIPHRP